MGRHISWNIYDTVAHFITKPAALYVHKQTSKSPASSIINDCGVVKRRRPVSLLQTFLWEIIFLLSMECHHVGDQYIRWLAVICLFLCPDFCIKFIRLRTPHTSKWFWVVKWWWQIWVHNGFIEPISLRFRKSYLKNNMTTFFMNHSIVWPFSAAFLDKCKRCKIEICQWNTSQKKKNHVIGTSYLSLLFITIAF